MTAMSPNCSRIAGLSFRREAQRRLSVLDKETPMNWDQIQGDWMQFEDLTRIGGRRDELAKRLQARYGFAKGEAEREIDAWMKTQRRAA